jgi:hypothetical protein
MLFVVITKLNFLSMELHERIPPKTCHYKEILSPMLGINTNNDIKIWIIIL